MFARPRGADTAGTPSRAGGAGLLEVVAGPRPAGAGRPARAGRGLRRRRGHRARAAGGVLARAAAGRPAGGQRRDGGDRGGAGGVVGPGRRRPGPDRGAAGRTGRRVHRLAAAPCPCTTWTGVTPVTVHFIGAGPGRGGPDHLARPQRLIAVVAGLPVRRQPGAGARCSTTARRAPGWSTPPTLTWTRSSPSWWPRRAGHDVARLHSGDPSVFSAMAEQMRRLDAAGVAYDVTPGVPAFAAAAASLRRELTVPGVGADA